MSDWKRGEEHESKRTLYHAPTGLKFVCDDHRLAFDDKLKRRLDQAIDVLLVRDGAPGRIVHLNGSLVVLAGREATYDEIVRAAGMAGMPTITWRNDPYHGMLAPGECLGIESGMHIDVAHTGGA